jgi:hypothetical protein
MGLQERINRLEARLQALAKQGAPAARLLPTLMVALDVSSSDQLDVGYEVEHAGRTWTQGDNETVGQLLARAGAECPPALKTTNEHGVPLLLVAHRRHPLPDA